MKALLAWYRVHQRDLPWRKTRNAYRIFISEIMLQQTQVDRVIPAYRAWLTRFPSWTSLAKATTADLLRAWAGLGYNRRALQVREGARFVVRHGEPKDEQGWRALKGVGPYTAAALTEFANHTRAIVIDTNVRRVAGRILFGTYFPGLKIDARLRKALDRITPRTGAHWDLPQAFMDLGSAICTARAPSCAACPMKRACKAAPHFLTGRANAARRPKTPREKRHRDKKYPDRIYRGRILAWVRDHGATSIRALGANIDNAYRSREDFAWVSAMCGRLAAEGLLDLDRNGTVSLPHS